MSNKGFGVEVVVWVLKCFLVQYGKDNNKYLTMYRSKINTAGEAHEAIRWRMCSSGMKPCFGGFDMKRAS